MTTRTCPVCGVPEQRQKDTFGREQTNLCPFTDKCIGCLVKAVKVKPLPEPEPFDPKRAQCGRDAE